MDIVTELEQEVSIAASYMTYEVIERLLDKWEEDLIHLQIVDSLQMQSVLKQYVHLKKRLLHMKKLWYYPNAAWGSNFLSEDKLTEIIDRATKLTIEARRKYYVAKRRVEGQHPGECNCRGCRCIKGTSA
jgi:hypothetical protein